MLFRYIFCLVCGALIAGSAWAQGSGIKLGATLPNWRYAADSSANLTTGNMGNFTLALVQEFPLGGIFAIQLEPTYSVRTTTTDILTSMLAQYSPDSIPSTFPSALEFEHQITSVEIPILLKISTGTEGIRGYLFAGPNVRIQLSAVTRLRTDTTNLNTDTQIPLDVRPKARTAVAAADIGAGIEIPLGLVSLVADARYTFPITDMSSLEAFGRRLGTLNSNDIRIFAGLMFRW
ncbi:MAG: PorT family protein [Chlorobi bacterium]|nr:PorT family protein [Chlorobiota bacterium]